MFGSFNLSSWELPGILPESLLLLKSKTSSSLSLDNVCGILAERLLYETSKISSFLRPQNCVGSIQRCRFVRGSKASGSWDCLKKLGFLLSSLFLERSKTVVLFVWLPQLPASAAAAIFLKILFVWLTLVLASNCCVWRRDLRLTP